MTCSLGINCKQPYLDIAKKWMKSKREILLTAVSNWGVPNIPVSPAGFTPLPVEPPLADGLNPATAILVTSASSGDLGFA